MIHLLELLRHFFLLVGKQFNDSRTLVQHLLNLSQLGLKDCLCLLTLILAFGIKRCDLRLQLFQLLLMHLDLLISLAQVLIHGEVLVLQIVNLALSVPHCSGMLQVQSLAVTLHPLKATLVLRDPLAILVIQSVLLQLHTLNDFSEAFFFTF